MNQTNFSSDLLMVAVLFAAGAKAQAQGVTITVIPALAPNAYGSPNWNAWVSNATTAIANGYASYGDPSSPSYYQQAPAVISVTNDIVTGFPSWDGLADPGDVFGANFSQELGNRIQFGIDIKGGTNLISISQLSFSAHSSDASNSLDFAFAQGSYNYSASYVGHHLRTRRHQHLHHQRTGDATGERNRRARLGQRVGHL